MPLSTSITIAATTEGLVGFRGILVPGVAAMLVTALLMTAVFGYLAITSRSRPLAFWVAAWAAASLRAVGELKDVFVGEDVVLDAFFDASMVAYCLLLLAGTLAFYQRRLSIVWSIVGAIIVVAVSVTRVADAPFLATHLPLGAFLAATLFYNSALLLRARHPAGIGRAIAGWSLLLSGLHVLDYAFVQPDEELAAWGFVSAGVLQFAIAIGVVILHFERARGALRQSERRFRALFENSIDGMFRALPDERFVAVNPALVQLLGAEDANALMADIRLSDLFPGGAAPSSDPRLLALDPSLRPRLSYLRPDRTHVDIDVTSWNVRDEAGEIVWYEGIVRDVTREQAIQSRLFQARKLEAIGQLAGGIAHDFNNLLTVISGCTTMLKRSGSRAERDELLDDIGTAADRAADLTAKLLTFSRQRASESKRVDLVPVIGQTASMLHRLIGEHVELELELPDEPCVIDADVHLIEQAVLNLAVNARDAMAEGGVLTITLARHGTDIALAVSDTGEGIAPEALPHIFEPFFTTKDVGEGTGLGLATVYGAVSQLNGDIDVESELGRGTRFTMRFPARSAPSTEVTVIEPEPEPAPRARLLLVEDEDAVRRLAVRLLRDAGHDVHPASDGEEAWAAFEGSPARFDAVVTDVVMPHLGGLGLASRVRALRPEMPIIFVTGYPHRGDGGGSIDDGATVVDKPFTRASLCEAVGSALAGRNGDDSPGEARHEVVKDLGPPA